MGRGLGINATLYAAIESGYGSIPGSGFKKLGIISHNLGEEQPLIEDDQLGFGREGLDPTYDAITNNSDLTVPLETRGIGFHLTTTFGLPTTTSQGGGMFQHVFNSGAAVLPSFSGEAGNPDVPNFAMNYGNAVNTIKIGMAKTGNINAALSLIGQGEAAGSSSSAAGSVTSLNGPRFAAASGYVTIDGTPSGEVTGANVGYTNNLEVVPTLRADGRIGGINPGVARGSGDVTLLLDPTSILLRGRKTPVGLGFGWANGSSSLLFGFARTFLPKPKQMISGPKGILATFNWQASGQSGPQLVATLINDVASYAA